MSRPRTVWRLVGVPELPQRLHVELTVDTVAAPVREAIEQAAARYGIELERVGYVEAELDVDDDEASS